MFLDGLDEMPEGLRARALKRVGEEARGVRIVVTSRPEEYRRALQSGGLGNTAVIELRPVRPNAAANYLQHGQSGLSRRQWEQVGAYLKGSPSSVAARALDNPLTLSLARDSYTTQDPTVLTDPGRFPTEDAVREHLIDQLLITAYPDEHQRMQITSWLAWIAHQMGTNRDLPWWEISTWIPQWKLHIACGLVIGLVVGATAAFAASHLVGLIAGHVHGPVAAITAGLVVGVGAGIFAELRGGLRHTPRTLTPRWPRTRQLAWILEVGLGIGLVVGLGVGLPIWLLAAQVPLVKLTELVLACQGSGRVHFLHLLEEAFSRQVLRQAGAVYQFRHAALQDRLAETYSQFPAL